MPEIILEDLSDAHAAVINSFITEGKLRAYEEILFELERENMANKTEDPYYGYYIEYIINKINEKYLPLKQSVEE